MSENESPFQQRLQRNAIEALSGLRGMYAASFYIGVAMLLTLPVMGVFGEGDYIIAVMALIYAALFILGLRIRRSALRGTAQRSTGLWIAIWSFIMASCLGAMAIAFLLQAGG